MAKRDNFALVLMTHCKVKLKCDDEKLECRYLRVEGKDYGTWWINGQDTGLQVIALIKELKSKYKIIYVTYKRQY